MNIKTRGTGDVLLQQGEERMYYYNRGNRGCIIATGGKGDASSQPNFIAIIQRVVRLIEAHN